MTQNECEKILNQMFDEIDLYFWDEDIEKPLIPIKAFPFKNFDKPSLGYWFEVKHIPVMPRQIEMGQHSMNEWKGIMQINICVYKDITARRITHKDKDVEFYIENAYAKIAEVMKRGVIKDRVHIVKVGKSSAIDNSDYYSVPISIEWYANLSN